MSPFSFESVKKGMGWGNLYFVISFKRENSETVENIFLCKRSLNFRTVMAAKIFFFTILPVANCNVLYDLCI